MYYYVVLAASSRKHNVKADVIRAYVSANRHDVIRTYGHFGYTRQMATLDVTDNKSNYTDPNRNSNPNWHSNGNILRAFRWK